MAKKQSKPEREPRQCLFCDRIASSPEHMWSDWMRPHFTRGAHDKSLETNHRMSAERTYEPTARIHHGHPTTRKVKAVCKKCNEGWMSGLEAAAKPFLEPMIQGRSVRLDATAQRTVTEWVTLKMMVWEVTDERGTVFTREETLAFAEGRALPDNLQIYVLRADFHASRVTRSFMELFLTREGAVAKTNKPNTQTVLFGIGQLLIFFAHSSIPDLEFWSFRQPYAKRLWFTERPTLWPPLRKTSDALAANIAGGLTRFVERPGVVRF